jgi:DNA mismatch repair protein MutS
MPETTPMMRQYRSIKSRHPDSLLFFRLGDFYEMFEQDAVEASRLLDLTLTQRQGVPMCGVPYHAAQGYIGRLLKAGRKIAICEQLELSRTGIARREVIEVITPGTVTDENLLEKTANNYLVCICRTGDALALACIDLSTGYFAATHFAASAAAERLRGEFLSLAPREVLVQESLLEEDEALRSLLAEREELVVNRLPDWSFDPQTNREALERQFRVASLKGFGLQELSPEIPAAGVLLSYLADTARGLLPHVRSLTVYAESSFLGLDESTLRNLEIVQNLNDRTRRYTLLELLDQTRTAAGSRKLKRWLLRPLKDVQGIGRRQEVVELLYRDQALLARFRAELGRVLDLERLASRVALEKAHAKDLLAVKSSLLAMLSAAGLLAGREELEERMAVLREREADIRGLAELLERAILEEPSILLTEGNLIKPGFDPEVDRYRKMKESARSVLKGYLEEERERSGIANLKLKYNRIIGYFLEVTRANAGMVPEHFIRRQTLVGGERFSTSKLGDLESEINSASERIVELERERFLEVRRAVRGQVELLLDLAELFSDLDVLQAFAFAATVRGYVRPELTEDRELSIEDGRHPVVEASLPGGAFVPNSLHLRRDGTSFILLTGPNMAGKSTFLRQCALIVLMAQAGSFVPAASARIGVVDHIFCRVGATDNLARGESTFLVEMTETAHILRRATADSLVIMDEVGRGTGTNDGLAIAWAVSEHMLEQVRAFTLFATHYHQLTALRHPALANFSMAVLEREGRIVFLKQVREGPTDNSYGIHAAELAGVPPEVIRRAGDLLGSLASRAGPSPLFAADAPAAQAAPPARGPLSAAEPQTAGYPRQGELFDPLDGIRGELLGLDLDRTTPLDALGILARLKRELGAEGQG